MTKFQSKFSERLNITPPHGTYLEISGEDSSSDYTVHAYEPGQDRLGESDKSITLKIKKEDFWTLLSRLPGNRVGQ